MTNPSRLITTLILLIAICSPVHAQDQVIFSNYNTAPVKNMITPHFTITQPMLITKITTYHWNDGHGVDKAGFIGIRGKEQWQAKGIAGAAKVKNGEWVVTPNLKLMPGTYYITDSDPATWSQNAGSDGLGFVSVEGHSLASKSSTGAPLGIKPSVKLDKSIFAPGESISVRFTAPAEYPTQAWMGIVPSGIPHGSEQENDRHDVAYAYLNGKTQGVVTLNAPPHPGPFDVRLHDSDNQGNEVASASFQVKVPTKNGLTLPTSNLTGTWQTSRGVVVLTQNNSRITGRIGPATITGSIGGNEFEGYWVGMSHKHPCDKPRKGEPYWGRVFWTFDNDSFSGYWGYCDDAPSDPWTGVREE